MVRNSKVWRRGGELTVIRAPKAPNRVPTSAPFIQKMPKKLATPPSPTVPINPPMAPATTGAASPPVIPMTAAPATDASPTFQYRLLWFSCLLFWASASADMVTAPPPLPPACACASADVDVSTSDLAISVSSPSSSASGSSSAEVRYVAMARECAE